MTSDDISNNFEAPPLTTEFRVVLDILITSVLVDGVENSQELIEFKHIAAYFNRLVNNQTILPPDAISAWYDARKKYISAQITGAKPDVFFEVLFAKIESPTLRKELLAAMFSISVSDNDFHETESDLIRKALQVWNTSKEELYNYDSSHFLH